jgi:hypothetical protein
MSVNQEDNLKELAKAFDRKVSKCRIFDANVCAWNKKSERPWELMPVVGSPFTLRTAGNFGTYRFEAMANPEYIALFLRSDLSIASLSVNQPDKNAAVFYGKSRAIDRALLVHRNKKRYAVFTSTGSLSTMQEALLDANEFRNLIEALQLADDESIHVSGGGLALYLRGRSVDSLRGILALCAALLNALNPEKMPAAADVSQIEDLPEAFRPLAPLVHKWAIDDDIERESLIEDSEVSELSDLIAAVAPHMAAIDGYLNSFGDRPLNSSAIKLGRLAEATAEARRRLEVTT